MLNETITKLLNTLTESEKDQIYRALWITHVKEDIRTLTSLQTATYTRATTTAICLTGTTSRHSLTKSKENRG